MNATPFEDMQNDLYFGDEVKSARPIPETGQQRFVTSDDGTYKEPCKKCRGSGSVTIGYTYLRPAKCFACDGRGFHAFKSSPEQRKRAADKREEQREEKKASASFEAAAWRAVHPEAAAWLAANAARNEFACDLTFSLDRRGRLTDGQLAAVMRNVACDKVRAAERAARVERAPTVDASRMEQAFSDARAAGLKRLQMRIGPFKVKPAGEASKNAGALYVTRERDDEYLGKIAGGRFLRVRACSEDEERSIVEACADPLAALVAHGKETGHCGICGLELTNPESIQRGIGPICAGKFKLL